MQPTVCTCLLLHICQREYKAQKSKASLPQSRCVALSIHREMTASYPSSNPVSINTTTHLRSFHSKMSTRLHCPLLSFVAIINHQNVIAAGSYAILPQTWWHKEKKKANGKERKFENTSQSHSSLSMDGH